MSHSINRSNIYNLTRKAISKGIKKQFQKARQITNISHFTLLGLEYLTIHLPMHLYTKIVLPLRFFSSAPSKDLDLDLDFMGMAN